MVADMSHAARIDRIGVVPSIDRTRGMIVAPGIFAPCALGWAGTSPRKREGDGATPVGVFHLKAILFRPDRIPRPRSGLPVTAITPASGWCDDPRHRAYNRPVTLPFDASHEQLWRDDRLYDIVVVIDYNLARPVPALGSAIFLHLARDDLSPTAGCVAVSLRTMQHLLPRIDGQTVLHIR
jgi:L,D-peptidoglycan transpeptidase YkuD (ErfK/YbiS/YcfS/YnhG family)